MSTQVKLSRKLLALGLTTSWTSGLLFFIFKKYPILKVHALSAFLMIILYGFYLGTHVLPRKKMRTQKPYATSLFACFTLLITTAYGLYYASNELFRNILIYTHLALGLIFPVILIAHIKSQLKKRSPK